MSCIFCRIIKEEIQSEIVYEDNDVIAIKDINPQAPVHILIIPKKHIENLNNVEDNDKLILGKIQIIASLIAAQHNIHNKGYRLILNCGLDAGQTVPHIHYHLLGGRLFRWPPG